MSKISLGVAALLTAGIAGLGCSSQSGIDIPGGDAAVGRGGTGGQASVAAGGVQTGGATTGGAGGAMQTGGATAGGAGGSSSASGGAISCPPIACPALGCVGGFVPNPDPCGCPLCGPNPDAGVTKDAGRICPPINCPAILCVTGLQPSPDPCGCPTCPTTCPPIQCPMLACASGDLVNPGDPCGCPICAPTADGGVAKDAGSADVLPAACPMLAKLNPTDAAPIGYSAGRVLLQCSFVGGTSEECVSNDVSRCSSGGVPENSRGCSDLCGPTEYGLSYGGVGPFASPPSIDLPTGCRLGLPTPGGVAFYCCPCGG